MKWALGVIFLVCEVAAAQSMLRVRPHIVVAPGSDVKLSQLVDAQNLSPVLMAKLAAQSVSVAPAFGEKQEIASANLTAVLRPLIREEREHTGQVVHVVIPNSVTIDTSKRDLDRDLVEEELMQAWQPLCSGCRLAVEALSLPRIDGIKDWTLRLKPELPRGSFSVPVDLVRENGSSTAAWISGRLITKRKVPVAKRAINIGERVTSQDFGWEFRDISYAIDSTPQAEEIAGKRMKQGLQSGEILWKNLLERERAVRAGDLVELRSAEGDWEVSLSVIAQQDAFIGDVINLKNPKSNSFLMGQVVGRGEVELR